MKPSRRGILAVAVGAGLWAALFAGGGPRALVVVAVAPVGEGAPAQPRLDRLRGAAVEVPLREPVPPEALSEARPWPDVQAALEAATVSSPPRRVVVGAPLDDGAFGRLADGLAPALPPSRTAWVVLDGKRAWLLGPRAPRPPAEPLDAAGLRRLLESWLD